MSIRNSHLPPALVAASARDHLRDTDLARALIAGAAWPYAETSNRFFPTVSNMALGSSSGAEDLVPEVTSRLAPKAKALRNPGIGVKWSQLSRHASRAPIHGCGTTRLCENGTRTAHGPLDPLVAAGICQIHGGTPK